MIAAVINGCSRLDAVSVFCRGPSVTHTSQSQRAFPPHNRLAGLIKVMFQTATWPIHANSHPYSTHTHINSQHILTETILRPLNITNSIAHNPYGTLHAYTSDVHTRARTYGSDTEQLLV